MHGCSLLTIGLRIPVIYAGTEQVGFLPTRQTLLRAPQARAAGRHSASRMKGDVHPSITGDHSKYDQILLVKKAKYIPGRTVLVCTVGPIYYGPQ